MGKKKLSQTVAHIKSSRDYLAGCLENLGREPVDPHMVDYHLTMMKDDLRSLSKQLDLGHQNPYANIGDG